MLGAAATYLLRKIRPEPWGPNPDQVMAFRDLRLFLELIELFIMAIYSYDISIHIYTISIDLYIQT